MIATDFYSSSDAWELHWLEMTVGGAGVRGGMEKTLSAWPSDASRRNGPGPPGAA